MTPQQSASDTPVTVVLAFLAAFVTGTVAATLVVPLGLIVNERVIWALALGTGGLTTGVVAAVALLSRDDAEDRTQVAAVALAMSGVGAAIGIGLYQLRDATIFPNLFAALVAHTAFLALDASMLSRALRSDRTRNDNILLAAVLIVNALIGVCVTVSEM